MKDNFSFQAAGYAKFRPLYPTGLFDFILRFVKEKNIAWDCGTGNGQSARVLSRYFKKVIATDISPQQIENAFKAPNIFYSVENAAQTGITNQTVDLITVAQAIHWFDFNAFYAEAFRVARPGAVMAAWAYGLPVISKEIDEIINNYHFITIGKYWDPERKYVDDGYATIPFPFKEVQAPQFNIALNWSQEELRGYLNTGSALQKFIAANAFNPVDNIIDKIKPLWSKELVQKIIFPLHLRLGIIN